MHKSKDFVSYTFIIALHPYQCAKFILVMSSWGLGNLYNCPKRNFELLCPDNPPSQAQKVIVHIPSIVQLYENLSLWF